MVALLWMVGMNSSRTWRKEDKKDFSRSGGESLRKCMIKPQPSNSEVGNMKVFSLG